MKHDDHYQRMDLPERRFDSVIGMHQDSAPPSVELKRFRISKRESQEKFWRRFGVTQSSGSRFETGVGIPAPVAILVKLYLNGKLSDGDLLGL